MCDSTKHNGLATRWLLDGYQCQIFNYFTQLIKSYQGEQGVLQSCRRPCQGVQRWKEGKPSLSVLQHLERTAPCNQGNEGQP